MRQANDRPQAGGSGGAQVLRPLSLQPPQIIRFAQQVRQNSRCKTPKDGNSRERDSRSREHRSQSIRTVSTTSALTIGLPPQGVDLLATHRCMRQYTIDEPFCREAASQVEKGAAQHDTHCRLRRLCSQQVVRALVSLCAHVAASESVIVVVGVGELHWTERVLGNQARSARTSTAMRKIS